MKLNVVIAVSLVFCSVLSASVATFEDITLGSLGYYPSDSTYGGTAGSTTFTSGGIDFVHNGNYWGGYYWDGFVVSNWTDTTTVDFTNQYSAYAGRGAGGSSNYAVAYNPQAIAFSTPTVVNSAYFTNTTYAALDMLNGSGFSKIFGGESGDDADWFKLTITGTNGASSSSIDFYLADYRFEDNSQDYIVSDWQLVDLSGLGAITSLEFSLTSSDNGNWGMNTPAYFAMDNLSIPEPMTLAVLALGGLLIRKK